MSIVDKIFDEVLNRKSIFKNRRVLSIDYVPETLPHREKEIEKLAKILATALKGGKPSNVFEYGKTGTGKTAVTLYVLNKLIQKAKQYNLHFAAAYVNTRMYNTPYKVLYKTATELGIKVPRTGLAVADIFEKVLRRIDMLESFVVIVLDEIDYLVKKKEGNDILYRLTRINNELENSQVSVIGITNDLRFKEFLDARVLSSLSEESIVFEPYTVEQLYDILKQRAELAFVDGAIDDSTLRLIAALSARESGDARKAIDLLRIAGEIAEREGAEKITEQHVRMAYEEVERDIIKAAIKSLPYQEKLVLLAIALLFTKSKKVTTGVVKKMYEKLCELTGTPPVTLRRMNDFINDLETLGLVSCQIVSFGRYGRTKVISLEIPSQTVFLVLTEADPLLAEILKDWSSFKFDA